MSGRRVSTGIVPDFGYTGKGVKIVDVGDGSPARKAGVKKGDILVSFGGVPIDNPRSYAGELRKDKPGDTVVMELVRGT